MTREATFLLVLAASAGVALAGCGGGGDGGPTEPVNEPPEASISAPATGSSFQEGTVVTLEGSATDPEQGQLGGDALVWSSDVDGQLGTGIEVEAPRLSPGDHEITLEATDNEGATGSDQIMISVVSDAPSDQAELRAAQLDALPGGALTDQTVDIAARVRNVGGVAAGAFDWRILLDGSEVASGRVDGIPARDSVELPRAEDLGPFAAGSQTVRLEVDTGDEVDEASEADNVAESVLAVYPPGMDIELRFVTTVTDSQRPAFEDAADRWQELLPGDLPDVQLSEQNSFDTSQCVDGGPTLEENFDDMIIVVRLDSIDGSGGVLGQAGPCGIRQTPDETVAVGAMEFDTADVEDLRRNGQLDQVILHEMGHVLGFGTLWTGRGLVEDAETGDPFFPGRQGRQAFLEVGGDAYQGVPVPVEGFGGAGTALGHWRETEFQDELMTGFIGSGENPLSILSVASMGDLNYATDASGADAYTFPAARSGGLRAGPSTAVPWERRLPAPLFGIDPETGDVELLQPVRRP